MNNEELKSKIKEILRKRMAELLGSCQTDEVPFDEKGAAAIMFYADEFADALIAAGIGDVAEEKNLREAAESFYMKKCKECSSISKELRQSKRALHCLASSFAEAMCKDGDTQYLVDGFIKDAYKQAEKEFAEENNVVE